MLTFPFPFQFPPITFQFQCTSQLAREQAEKVAAQPTVPETVAAAVVTTPSNVSIDTPTSLATPNVMTPSAVSMLASSPVPVSGVYSLLPQNMAVSGSPSSGAVTASAASTGTSDAIGVSMSNLSTPSTPIPGSANTGVLSVAMDATTTAAKY